MWAWITNATVRMLKKSATTLYFWVFWRSHRNWSGVLRLRSDQRLESLGSGWTSHSPFSRSCSWCRTVIYLEAWIGNTVLPENKYEKWTVYVAREKEKKRRREREKGRKRKWEKNTPISHCMVLYEHNNTHIARGSCRSLSDVTGEREKHKGV